MKYVRVEPLSDQYGFSLDPQGYLDVLPQLLEELPPGVTAYVTADGHYDFTSPRCVKDLTMRSLSIVDDGGEVSLECDLAPNEWKHDCGMHLRYSDLLSFQLNVEESDGMLPRLGILQLDEALPHPHGFTHEIAFTSGSIVVVATDLRAEWTVGIPSLVRCSPSLCW
ncbi:hypothetical protein [Streptomyces sp. NPDC000851]